MQPPIVEQRKVGDTRVTEFKLDPQQPFLNHHRPGGKPLMGTVMSIELMAQAARLHGGAKQIVSLGDIKAQIAYIFADERPQVMFVRTRAHGADRTDTRIDCEVFSLDAQGREVPHFTGRAQPAADFSGATLKETLPDVANAHEVTSADIYQSFFHGPSFQVLRSVRCTPSATIGYINTSLPPAYSPAEHDTAFAPRLIEFGLQTSGLMTIAELGQQRVPDQIGLIERFTAADVYAGTAWRAMASHDAQGVIEVRVVDAQNRLHLRILGYRTAPLPFAGDDQALLRLRAKLRNGVD